MPPKVFALFGCWLFVVSCSVELSEPSPSRPALPECDWVSQAGDVEQPELTPTCADTAVRCSPDACTPGELGLLATGCSTQQTLQAKEDGAHVQLLSETARELVLGYAAREGAGPENAKVHLRADAQDDAELRRMLELLAWLPPRRGVAGETPRARPRLERETRSGGARGLGR